MKQTQTFLYREGPANDDVEFITALLAAHPGGVGQEDAKVGVVHAHISHIHIPHRPQNLSQKSIPPFHIPFVILSSSHRVSSRVITRYSLTDSLRAGVYAV